MSPSERTRRSSGAGWEPWLGLFLPPAAWFAAQQLGFILVPSVCASGRRWILFAITGAALLATAAAGAAAWRRWMGTADSASPGPVERRRRQLAAAGVLLSVFFFLAIAAFAIPDVVQRPCD